MARRTGVEARQIVSIVMLLALLVAILTMRRSCAAGTAKLFDVVGAVGDGGPPPATRDAPARRD